MLHCRFAPFGRDSGVVRTLKTMVFSYRSSFGAGLALGLMGLGLAACGGRGVPPPTYRNLADIPDRPQVAPQSANEAVSQSLSEDRSKTNQAAEDLRTAPFDTPPGATMTPNPAP